MKKVLSLLLSIVIAVTSVVALPIVSQAAELKGYTAISTKEQFYNIRNNPLGKYYLTDDIVFDSSDFISHGDYYNNGNGYDPMDVFYGVFDGCGHTISGIKGESVISHGNDGTIKNLCIDDCSLSGGGITIGNYGLIYNCKISNSSADCGIASYNATDGIIDLCFSETSNTGICYENSGTIKNCINYSSITSTSDRIGGIAKCNYYNAIIDSCINKGNISTTSDEIGGIAGYNDGTISKCTNLGNISGDRGIAGIVGCSGEEHYNYNTDGEIEDCINSGIISGDHVSGIGDCDQVINCVNTGSVQNGKGDAISDYREIDCYYLSGSGTGDGTALTQSQMKQQSSFPILDFKNTWQIGNDGISLQATNYEKTGTIVYKLPSKTYYNIGDKLNLSGMYVMTFDNQGEWLITDDYTVSGFSSTSLGTKTVIITSGNSSASFNVVVRDSISKAKINLSKTQYTYTGKAIKPTVNVIASNGKILKLNTDYTVSYSANTNPGLASVTIKGKGYYTGSVKKTFTIIPMQTKGLKVSTRKTTSLKLAWTKQSGVTGYVLQKYDSKNKKWKNYKTITSNTNSVSVTKLSAAATYKFRVRSYKTISGKKYYGAYSSVLTTVTTPNQVKSVKAGFKINNKKHTAYCRTTWKKQKNVSGYQLNLGQEDYDTGKIKYYDTITVKGAGKSSYQFKFPYASDQGPDYIRVRSYKKVNGKNYYGAWSKADRTY